MNKKILIMIILIIIVVGSSFAFIYYKKSSTKNSVVEYLTTEKNIPKKNIIQSKPFIANLKGNKNYMVSVKLKNDNKTYYYYKDNGKVILESYVKNGKEHVINK
ncbi:DUF3139 domain-containing protein [Heyndrickxia coagulans]|uniref:DUF3139 domain-containing protein n=1 Tax=Heyndrickxia coagulans TaxID=1398 RepID=UPI00047E3752|nr:DUF3139 domain-containing protein [Heyndrickxia coagulans]